MLIRLKLFLALIRQRFLNKFFDFENRYYVDLFVNNSIWNTPEPNEDENFRWIEIKKMIDFIDLHDLQILDVGCGRGWLTNKLSNYGEVTGIEPVSDVVLFARELFPNLDFHADTPVDFERKNPEKKFDLIVCSEVIEHVIDKKSFVATLSRLLKNNGYIILTTPRGELRKHWEEIQSKPSQPVEDWISTVDLVTLMKNSRFDVLRTTFTYIEDIYQIHLCQKINSNNDVS